MIGAFAGCTAQQPTTQAPDTFDAIVYGGVTGPSGEPVARTQVFLEHRPEGCDGLRNEQDRGMTDAQGDYQIVFRLGTARKPSSCFVAWAKPASANRLQQSDTIPFDVRFGDPDHATPDSVRVDLVLR
jgi:hypothetical protein